MSDKLIEICIFVGVFTFLIICIIPFFIDERNVQMLDIEEDDNFANNFEKKWEKK